MPWSYNRLWKLLIDKNLKKTDLLSIAKINRKTLANMGKNETVSMDALEKICASLNCRIEDIVEFVPEEPKKD
jgi:DNA-binding Xre family transcriptional regulator